MQSEVVRTPSDQSVYDERSREWLSSRDDTEGSLADGLVNAFPSRPFETHRTVFDAVKSVDAFLSCRKVCDRECTVLNALFHVVVMKLEGCSETVAEWQHEESQAALELKAR